MSAVATRPVDVLGNVLASLNRAGVSWAVLRGGNGLGTSGRDVDLLVAAEDVACFEDVVFELGGVALPRRLHPWHRFYVLGRGRDAGKLTLDVVTELVYGRPLMLRSGLERHCLDRRVEVGATYVLDPTDAFWTVLLHCLLDKQAVNERRATELADVVDRLDRPSPGEVFFETLCPPAWSPGRAVDAVRARDWESLVAVGRQILASPDRRPPSPGRDAARGGAPAVAAAARALRALARAAYPGLWRQAGLGVTPSVLGVVEGAGVEATVMDVRRRPARCDVVLLVPDRVVPVLSAALRDRGYRAGAPPVAGQVWRRLGGTGLESVRLVSPLVLGLSPAAAEAVRSSSRPDGVRSLCRRASPAWSLLLAVLGGWERRGAEPGGTDDSDARWAHVLEQARHLAEVHGLLDRCHASRGRRLRVSFSGLDGAGKTRQIEALVTAVRQDVSVEVLWMPFKVWPESLLNRLPAGFRSRLGPKRVAPTQHAAAPATDVSVDRNRPAHATLESRRRRGPRSLVWTVIATLAAVSAGLGLRRRARAGTADLVVLDRYRLDSLVKLQFWYGEVSPGWLTRVVTTLAPAPDLELLLRVEPEVAYARKPEQWSVEQLSRQARCYDGLARRVPRIVVLAGDDDPDELAQRVASLVKAVRGVQ